MFYGRKVTLILTFLVSNTLLYATIDEHTFDVEKGTVIYDINGGGVLTPETNLTLHGQATLRFKEWGATLLSKEEGTVVTSGALKSKQSIRSLEKQNNKTLYTVDFKNQKIHERKNSIANALREHDTRGLKNIGEDEVLGLKCTVWEGQGVRKCLYKGLPLKIESDVLGISYHKVATRVLFDVNSSSSECVLPDFPTENFALFNTTLKTKNETKAKCFTEVLKDVAYTVEKKVIKNGNHLGISQKEKTLFLNKIGKKIYEYQKSLLPKLLASMKKTRECLQGVENMSDANQCLEAYNALNVNVGIEESIDVWDEKQKGTLLDKIENQINQLESSMPCIKRAKNITDLSACMK
ncbi:MAG TPA: hypothetical protein ENK98_08660 [Epsilonproteobacteria bacterium]|nr:hypothetical protein [Campylobacterota bacterium]